MSAKAGNLLIDDPELVSWIKQNPLYIFRESKGFALRNAAARLGRSQTTVSKWEDGTAYPTEDNMRLIAKMMKLAVGELNKQWRAWYQIKHPLEQTRSGDKQKDTNKN